jgi:signal transduction histidine kinase/CheY-like chemotaxis protein
MRRPRARSLRRKLMLVILLTTGVALLFAFGAHAFLQYYTTRNELLQVASSMAEVVAANSTAALTFDDPSAARQTLSSLRVRPSIVAACLYTTSGALFSTYRRSGAEGVSLPPTPGPDGHLFGGGHLVVVRPVMLDGERIGTVYLRMELTEVVQQQIRYAGMILLFLAGSGIVALLVASRLQRVVSGPILGLADAARSVSESRDYSVRVPVRADDEIGSLSAAFNTMLGRIETEEAALKAAQNDLKAKVHELELEVSEREEAEKALKLSEEQLVQAQKMEAIGRLAGGVAHDFNNLLTVINGYSELIQLEMGVDDPLRPTIAEIRHAGERAAGLTRQLLAFGRKQMIAPRVIDLNAVIENTQAMLRRLIGEDIALEVTLDPGVPPVKADPSQLDQLILNLAVNARDAMPQGGGLSIETANVTLKESPARSPEVLPGQYVAIRVADTGCGMDAGTMAHIFEPFFTTKELGKGTGLGLSTVYGIVKQCGGHISVESEPGRGTTFQILLPAVETAADLRRSSGMHKALLGGSETVLLVEDEAPVRGMISRILSASGYKVLQAPDGPSALAIADAHETPIHLVLTDIVMPGMNGRSLVEALAAKRPGIRALYMSGYSDDVISHQGLVEEGIPFISKPFRPSDLASKVRSLLEVG